jgi:type IV pilus assembly protein PilW
VKTIMNTSKRPIQRAAFARERGLTLIELMVAMTIGLLIVAATTGIFVNSSATRRQIESSADVIESGRYALDLLGRELSQTGYYGTLSSPKGAAVPDPCATDVAAWAGSLEVPVFGLNNADANPACLANRKANTDAVFIQRASTCTTAEGGVCAEDDKNGYIQVSECGDEYSVTPFVVAKGKDAGLKLQTRACDGTKAEIRKLIRRTYYVSTADVLSYVDVTPLGAQPEVKLIENVEQMQIEYAVDTDSDATPDKFTATPADWSQVIGLRIWVLARSTDTSTNAKNALTIQMSGDTTINVAAAASNFKRRVYSTYIPFTTPKLRRES